MIMVERERERGGGRENAQILSVRLGRGCQKNPSAEKIVIPEEPLVVERMGCLL